MLQVGKSYKYKIDNEEFPNNDITIEQIVDNIAIATSGSFGDVGPFSMTFNINTGKGVGQYTGTHLVI